MKIDEYYEGTVRTHQRSFSYHISDFDREDVIIKGIGLREVMKPCWNRREDGNSDYKLLYFYDEVFFRLKETSEKEIKNRWIILSPGTPHSYGHSGKTWNHSWIHLGGEQVEKELIESNLPLNRLINSESPLIFDHFLKRLHDEIFYFDPPDFTLVMHEISIFIRKLKRSISLQHHDRVIPDSLNRARQYIDLNYNEHISLDSLGTVTGYSPQYFSSLFTETFGLPPIEYLICRRIDMAKYLLHSTSLPVGEISLKVGYNDIYYFSRLFKRRTDLSPRAYRKQYS